MKEIPPQISQTKGATFWGGAFLRGKILLDSCAYKGICQLKVKTGESLKTLSEVAHR